MALNRFLSVAVIILSLIPFSSLFSQWTVKGGIYNIYEYVPETSTGIKNLYILYGDNNLSIEYNIDSNNYSKIEFFRYNNSAIEGEKIESTIIGNIVSVNNPTSGYGYFLELDGIRTSYIWVINYKEYEISMNSLTYNNELSDCDYTKLIFDRDAVNITFNSINGRQNIIPRYVEITYDNIKPNEENFDFETFQVKEQIIANKEISLPSVYVNTVASITGDQFLKYWEISKTIFSDQIIAKAVEGIAKAEMEEREAGNEIDKYTSDFSGSAPINMEFSGIANYPVTTYQAWQISKDQDFGIIEATYTDANLSYSFVDEGKTYVRYTISNADASCEKVISTYTIDCSESSLEIPNVFTPDSPSGNNREFKVAYRSIIKFKGWIFNRWGNQLFHWTDPSQGWDGKYNGKLVPTGAYFYVIEAEGVGGKKYKKKGDINVIRTKE